MPATQASTLLMGADDDLLLCGSAQIARGAFRRRATALAARLPEASHVINLCERRDHFMLGFCAALLRGQVTLLPPSRAPDVVKEVAMRYPGCYRLGDAATEADCDARVDAATTSDDGDVPTPSLNVPAGQLAMIGFTSGSTGTPSAHAKTWGSLVHTNAANLRALADLFDGALASIVATVPPQHMFGMEMSVLLPLLGPFAVHPGRPFFPQDIARALAECAAPRLLVTTPVHLRALIEADIELPPVSAITTATAPLPAALAHSAETRFGCEVRELFGATEICIIASRRTACEEAWSLYDDTILHPLDDGTRVERPSLAEPVQLADRVELVDDGRGFVLRGRQADLLEIAGKRASLGDLTQRLLAVEGIQDAAMVQPDADAMGVARLVAIIVAEPETRDDAILAALRHGTDPVFLPRRIIRVDALPRNDTGKLPREAVAALLSKA